MRRMGEPRCGIRVPEPGCCVTSSGARAIDRASRRVVAWRLSNTLATDFCLDAVQETITRCSRPEIFNKDQRSQFSSREYTGLLKDHGIQIRMDLDGKPPIMCTALL